MAGVVLVKFLAVARLGAAGAPPAANALIAVHPIADDRQSKTYKAYCKDLMGKSTQMQAGKQNVLTAPDFDFVIMPDPTEAHTMLFFAVLDKKFGHHFDSANLFEEFKTGFYRDVSSGDIASAEPEGVVHQRVQELLRSLCTRYGAGEGGAAAAVSAPTPAAEPPIPPARPDVGRRPRGDAAAKGWGTDAPAPPPPASTSPPITPTGGAPAEVPKFGRRRDGAPPSTAGSVASIPSMGETKKAMDRYDGGDSVQAISEIPDLESEEQDDYTDKIAHAPNVRSKQVQTLSDLDGAGGFTLPSTTPEGVDLTLLCAALAPKEKIGEPDVMWDFDSLFSHLSSEMQSEEGEEEEGEFTIAPKMGGPIIKEEKKEGKDEMRK